MHIASEKEVRCGVGLWQAYMYHVLHCTCIVASHTLMYPRVSCVHAPCMRRATARVGSGLAREP